MMVLFEVFLARGSGGAAPLLSEETTRDTQAQVMTLAEARAVGFAGLPDGDATPGTEVRLVAVAQRDATRIQRALEASEQVARFRVHDVG